MAQGATIFVVVALGLAVASPPDLDLHSLTLIVQGAAAFFGTVCGLVGVMIRLSRVEASQTALHKRLDDAGVPMSTGRDIGQERPPPRDWLWRRKPDLRALPPQDTDTANNKPPEETK